MYDDVANNNDDVFEIRYGTCIIYVCIYNSEVFDIEKGIVRCETAEPKNMKKEEVASHKKKSKHSHIIFSRHHLKELIHTQNQSREFKFELRTITQ